jgi:hypothetical protein
MEHQKSSSCSRTFVTIQISVYWTRILEVPNSNLRTILTEVYTSLVGLSKENLETQEGD